MLKVYQPLIYKQYDNTENHASSVFIGMSARCIQVVFLHMATPSIANSKNTRTVWYVLINLLFTY